MVRSNGVFHTGRRRDRDSLAAWSSRGRRKIEIQDHVPRFSKEAEENELPTGLPCQDCVNHIEITPDNWVVSTKNIP